ncbi:anti-virulence regulator CigR family protein [Pseudomonas maumuensis]|uniref:Nickel/cobalt transporter regulator n=1 Tax=Pseudomonas maumuensis TaxID=2842354 RepID=A0ABX8NGL1_9PSED|nr:anti-virulence regulator CigR family protein [Pseudomonas maumuensis]QXH54945.1 hypothetical protein KSS90_16450 [Pseudomonas maumuensis]
MSKRRTVIAALTSMALVMGPCVSSADPGNGKGHGKGQAQQKHGDPGVGKLDGGHGGPVIDQGDVLGILGGHRDYWRPGPALPPGIQKNLARGKALPPGIAKQLDGRLLGQLPSYDGYEWMQAGVDLILVAVATGVIYEVLSGAFD